jgi:hypothetical protein
MLITFPTLRSRRAHTPHPGGNLYADTCLPSSLTTGLLSTRSSRGTAGPVPAPGSRAERGPQGSWAEGGTAASLAGCSRGALCRGARSTHPSSSSTHPIPHVAARSDHVSPRCAHLCLTSTSGPGHRPLHSFALPRTPGRRLGLPEPPGPTGLARPPLPRGAQDSPAARPCLLHAPGTAAQPRPASPAAEPAGSAATAEPQRRQLPPPSQAPPRCGPGVSGFPRSGPPNAPASASAPANAVPGSSPEAPALRSPAPRLGCSPGRHRSRGRRGPRPDCPAAESGTATSRLRKGKVLWDKGP